MENLAKAVVIAGGVLFAIMTLTLLVYGITTTSRITEAQQQAKDAQELVDFNLQFESYNKRRMYGIDVITVVNKAIENNHKMDAEEKPEDRHYIDVVINTHQEFRNELYKKVVDSSGNTVSEDYYKNIQKSKIGEVIPPDSEFQKIRDTYSDTVILENNEYHLITFIGDHRVKTNQDFVLLFQGYTTDLNITKSNYLDGSTVTCKLYSALTNFKRAIFTSEIEYDGAGRVKTMTFNQIKRADF